MSAPSIKIIDAIAVTAELTGTMLSEAASRVMADDLSRYPEQQVLVALTRCRRELRGRLTIAEVLSRLDDGRPDVEEAWAMVPKSEADTVVWTAEMSIAMRNAGELLAQGDSIGARMAFKETYLKLCQKARDSQTPVSWQVSQGWDSSGREGVLVEAVKLGRLPVTHAKQFLPHIEDILENKPMLEPMAAIKQLAERMKAA